MIQLLIESFQLLKQVDLAENELTFQLVAASTLLFIGKFMALLWMVRIAWGITTKLADRPSLTSKFSLLVATTFLVAYFLVIDFPIVFNEYFNGFRQNYLLVKEQLAWFALATYILVTFKAATALELAEQEGRPSITQRFKNWIAFLIFPIGLWWMQPRIKLAISHNQGLAIEEHLL